MEKYNRVVALDISSKTGWAIFQGGKLEKYGLFSLPKRIKEYGLYPESYILAATAMVDLIYTISVDKNTVYVIEETNSSRSRYTQKILEYIHCLFLDRFFSTTDSNFPKEVIYISTSIWRKAVGVVMSKEDKKNNFKISKAKREGKSKSDLGVKGKVTAKHLSVRHVNEKYGLNLKLKNNNEADAIALGEAYLSGAVRADGII